MGATVDLNDVAAFVCVAETGSFTRAAQQLGVPKSTVSRRVAHLEEALGVRLLQRTTRQLGLTDAGTAYHAHAARALGDLREGASAVEDLRGAPRGTLRVTAPADLGATVLADLVAAFQRRYPEVRVDVALTGRVVDLVAEGFDVALRAGRVEDGSLVARRVIDLASVLVATPAYLAARGTPRAPGDLAGHACVLFRPRLGRATWALDGPDGRVEVEVTGVLGGDDFLYLHRLVLADQGLGLLPTLVCVPDLEAGRLVRVLPDHAFRGGQLLFVHPSSRLVPARVAAFRDFVLETLRARCVTEGRGPGGS